MKLKNAIEPRMNTDETRIYNCSSGEIIFVTHVSFDSRDMHGFISVYPCSSVARKGL